MAEAMPQQRPPPPYGTMTVSTSGRSSTISRAIVPFPAITAESLNGWTKTPSRAPWRRVRKTSSHCAKGTPTTGAEARERFRLRGRRSVRHDDRARDTHATGDPCDALPHVPRARRPDAGCELILIR
jgi:hypothetical protein